MGLFNWTIEKLNPAQRYISSEGKLEVSTSASAYYSYQQCFEKLEVVNRGINMIVDDTAAISYTVGDNKKSTKFGLKKSTLNYLLNVEPNPFQDIDAFRRTCLMDLVIEGNIFIYFDGAHMYHLPANKVTILSDPKTFISGYKYDGGGLTYNVDEIIHIKDNSFKSIFRGDSRLRPCVDTMNLIIRMRKFQKNFFDNGAVPGLVIKTKDTLNQRLKDRLLGEWLTKYRPDSGGKRPIILDGGMEIDTISAVNFKELDFQQAIIESEKIILKCLGIPPLLIDSGNNANIRPNHRMYYLETIIPIINKLNSAYSRFFGFEIYEDVSYIEALRPELSDQANYLQSLVNGGIITANEARLELGKEPLAGHDDIRIPANIAGSAANPSLGGAPGGKE